MLITAGHRIKTTGSPEISIKKKKHQNSQNQHDYKEFQYFNLTTWNYNSIKTHKVVFAGMGHYLQWINWAKNKMKLWKTKSYMEAINNHKTREMMIIKVQLMMKMML